LDAEQERKAVKERLDKAPTPKSTDRTGDRIGYNLYAGNFPFHASDDHLLESINPCFKRIQVENVTFPPKKGGQHRGYGLIRLSWARGAPIDLADICIQLSGRIKVNSSRIHLCETDDTSSDPSEFATGTGSPATSNRSGPDQQDTGFVGYFSPSGGESEYCPSSGESDQE
jgi:hypothetical protein